MMKSKNIILYEILGVLLLFTIIYFVVANKVSYAFSYDETHTLYESKMNLINNMAILYAENNLTLFEEEKTIYITVDELVENAYLVADDENGKIKDPTSDVKTLNDIKIRITNKNGKFESKILS